MIIGALFGLHGCKIETNVKNSCCDFISQSELNIYNKGLRVFKFHEYESGLKCAKKLNKPILLNFSSYILPYDEFEYDLIRDAKVKYILNQEYVVIKLYRDDKRELDSLNLALYREIGLTEKSINNISKKRTIGSLNSAIQWDLFKSNYQPEYIVMNHMNQILVKPFGYTSRNKSMFFDQINKGYKSQVKIE